MVSPSITGIIGLKNLPLNKILVGLTQSFKEAILNCVDIKVAAKSLNLRPSNFYNFKNNDKVTIEFLLNLSDYLIKQGFKQFSYEQIEKNIELIGTKRGNVYIKNPKLPFNFNNKEGAYFISAIFFDGGIDNQFKPHYGNLDKNMRLRIIRCVEEIFGEIHSKETNAQTRHFIRFPKVMGIILNHCFNIGVGNKMYHNNKIPDFIFNLDKDIKACFIRQAFDDDGSVSVNKKMVRIVGVTDVKKENFNKDMTKYFNLLNGVKKLLYDFDIDPNPLRTGQSFSNIEYRKKGEFYRHIFTFSITGRDNLETFYNQIGFNIDYKMKGLNSLLKSYKMRQLRKGEINKIAFEKCKEMKNITIPFLAKEINRSYRQTVRVMKVLEEKKLVKLKNPSVNIGGRRVSAIYELI